MRCAVSGKRISQVAELDSLGREIPTTTGEAFGFIKKTKPPMQSPDDRYMTGETLLEPYCRTLIADGFGDHNQPHLADYGLPDLTHSVELVKLAWDQRVSDKKYEDAVNGSKSYLHTVHRATNNRRFRTAKGHVGLAPLETKVGDILAVLFKQVPWDLAANFRSSLDSCRALLRAWPHGWRGRLSRQAYREV